MADWRTVDIETCARNLLVSYTKIIKVKKRSNKNLKNVKNVKNVTKIKNRF